MVLVRSNSRISGSTSDERNTGRSGRAARNRAPMARSWASLRKEYSRQTATASMSWRLMKSMASSTSSSHRGVTAPCGVDALGDLQAMVARHQHGGRVLEEVVQGGPRRAAQLQHVAEAPRGDERRARAPAFEQGVGHHGRRVGQEGHVGGGETMALEGCGQGLEHAAGEVARGGGDLDHGDPRAALLGEDHIGEGPADVDAEAPAHRREPAPLRWRGRAARASANTCRVRAMSSALWARDM